MIDPTMATAFLAAGRIAVVGASDDSGNFGRTIVKALSEHGVDTVAVHPHATTVAGVPSYPSLAAVPDQIDGVIVMVPHDHAVTVVRECVAQHISRVWLFRGMGRGAVSPAAIELCEQNGIELIAGACPLMFLEPVSGVHKLHRTVRRANRSLAKATA